MKFATSKEHRDYFNQNGLIEFETFLSPEHVSQLNQSIDQALAQRLNCPSSQLKQMTSEQLFLNGRDVWRVEDKIRRLISQPHFGEIASELLGKKPIRLGYDQLLPARHYAAMKRPSVYGTFLEQSASLEEISCLDHLLCGLIICLSPETEDSQPTDLPPLEGMDIFPSQPGHAIFFQPQAKINLSSLYRHPGQRFYLVVYTQANAHYYLQLRDPHTYALKHLGYIFQDPLKDKLNPVVLR